MDRCDDDVGIKPHRRVTPPALSIHCSTMSADDPRADRFEWPPRRVPESELNAPARPLDAGGRHRVASRSARAENATLDDDLGFDEPTSFVLDLDEPEFDTGETTSGDDAVSRSPDDGGVAVLPSPTRGMTRWIESFEIAYLGRVAASWDVRARDAGWSPDDEHAYCPRCGLTVGEFALDTLSDPPTCPACRDRKLPWDRYIRLGPYQGVLAGAIRELKFHAMRAHGERLGTLLGERIATLLRDLGVSGEHAAIVPVPMTPWRRIARGVDHAATIARSAARVAGVPVVHALWRRHRPTQWSVPTSERRRNVAGSFGVRRGWLGKRHDPIRRLQEARVVVVLDDVRTTGATMTEACRVLRRALEIEKISKRPIIVASTLAAAIVRAGNEPVRH